MAPLHRVLAPILVLACPYASRARAGNDEGILIGGQAALTGGAITASVSDGSAAWYNPAGLAHSTRPTLDVNGSAYGLSLQTASELFTLADGTTADADVVDWQLVPTALSYTRQLGTRCVAAFGIFVPYTTDVDLRTAATDADGRRWTFGVDQVRNEYDYIASLATRLSDTLRLGASLHGIYISSEEFVQIGVGTPAQAGAPFLTSSTHQTTSDYGLRIGLGAQWSPSPALSLGLSLQTPTLTGFRSTTSDTIDGSYGGDGGATFDSRHESAFDAVWELSTPLALRAGLAWSLGKTQLAIDGSLTSPIDSTNDDLDRKLSGNARLGALHQHSESLSFGAGVFSDLNGARGPGPNHLGVAGGVRFESHFHVTEHTRQLTFATTVAGRYAYGFGNVEGLSFAAGDSPESTLASLRVHELAINLGSAVSF